MKRLLLTCCLLLAAVPAAAQYAFQFEVPDQGAVADLVELHSFHNLVINTGSAEDTYTVSIVKDMPPDWVGSLCEGVICYPPFVTQITFTLAPGDTTELLMDITPLTDLGTGTSTLTLSSQGDPGLSVTRVFSVVTPGLDALLVDADGGQDYETYYRDALDAQGLSYGYWNRDAVGTLSATEMDSFATIVWLAGDNPDAMSLADLSGLQDFLRAGGDLVLSGQNLARDFCSPGGALYSPEARDLFNHILGADYLADDVNDDTIAGLGGDPVASGYALTLAGGSGANANTSPDRIAGVVAGAPSFEYSPGSVAAVRNTWNSGGSYFMAFGFENISSSTARRALMGDIIAWLQAPQVTAAGQVVPSRFAVEPAASPNPFNPRTVIRFTIGGQDPVAGSVAVYDLQGRLVRTLRTGVFQPGPVAVAWDGRDRRGAVAPGGVYLARVVLADGSRTVKLALAK